MTGRRRAAVVAAVVIVHVAIGYAVVFEGDPDPVALPARPDPGDAGVRAGPAGTTCVEVAPIEVPLAGAASPAKAEISGLAWHGDDAILLPQYPRRHADEGGVVFAIGRDALRAWLDDRSGGPIEPRHLAFDSGGLERTIDGFEGFEALAFDGDHVFVLVESNSLDGPRGHVFEGRIDAATGIAIDPDSGRLLQSQQRIANTAYEALVAFDDHVLALYELNGSENEGAFGLMVPRGHDGKGEVRTWATPLQFRLTDATAADGAGRFWVTNVYWPGDGRPRQPCSLFDAHGIGASHRDATGVERLVEAELHGGQLRPTGRPPVLLRLSGGETRNWEGLLRLGERGFLIVTDEHPRTILAFVEAR